MDFEHYIGDFESTDARVGAVQSSSVGRLRREAMQRFGELGFPNARLEDWRFTNVEPIARQKFRLATHERDADAAVEAVLANGVAGLDWPTRLVFIDGHYASHFSRTAALPAGAVVGSLQDAIALQAGPAAELEEIEELLSHSADANGQSFVALNTAFIEDGAFVRIPDGAVVADAICLVFVATGHETTVSHPRNLIVLGTNAQASVVECFLSARDGEYLTNVVTEVSIGANGSLDHSKLQAESDSAFHVATLAIRQAADSRFAAHSVSLGGALVRNDVTVVLEGAGAECALNGLYMVGGRQHVDNHTTIDHAAPRSSSEETYKGVLDGEAKAVFSGRVVVRQDAQKISARQSNKNLLLSDGAAIHTKPQLEIGADDVKCAHGATVGMLDSDALFYLRSRGLDAESARQLLVYAFAREVVDSIKVKALHDHLVGRLLARLPGGTALEELS